MPFSFYPDTNLRNDCIAINSIKGNLRPGYLEINVMDADGANEATNCLLTHPGTSSKAFAPSSGKTPARLIPHLVPKRGLEPPRPNGHMTLNHARLPIPPLGPDGAGCLRCFARIRFVIACIQRPADCQCLSCAESSAQAGARAMHLRRVFRNLPLSPGFLWNRLFFGTQAHVLCLYPPR